MTVDKTLKAYCKNTGHEMNIEIFDNRYGYVHGSDDCFALDECRIVKCTELLAEKSYRGETETDKLVFEGDIVTIEGYGTCCIKHTGLAFIITDTREHKTSEFNYKQLTFNDKITNILGNIYTKPNVCDNDDKMRKERSDERMKNYKLMYDHFKCGLGVFNACDINKETGYAKIIAFIRPDRNVVFYDTDAPNEIKAQILKVARTSKNEDYGICLFTTTHKPE